MSTPKYQKDIRKSAALEAKAYEKLITELSKIFNKHNKKHQSIVDEKKQRFDSLMNDYKSEEEAHEAYGYDLITEEEYREIVSMLETNEASAEEPTLYSIMANILGETIKGYRINQRDLAYEAMTDEQKQKHDEGVERSRQHLAELKAKRGVK